MLKHLSHYQAVIVPHFNAEAETSTDELPMDETALSYLRPGEVIIDLNNMLLNQSSTCII